MISKPLATSLKESLELKTAGYVQQMNRDAAQYLTARGLNRDTAERFRLGFVAHPLSSEDRNFVGRLTIPSIGPTGNIYGLKFRKIDDETPGPKYMNTAGLSQRPFNLRALLEADQRIVICEGEIDAMTLDQCGLPAVGIPGVDHWHKQLARMFVGFSEVIVVGDSDPEGQGARFSAQVAKDVYSSRRVVIAQERADINSLYCEGGSELVYDVLGLTPV